MHTFFRAPIHSIKLFQVISQHIDQLDRVENKLVRQIENKAAHSLTPRFFLRVECFCADDASKYGSYRQPFSVL